ncbi:hypothetical protein GCM10023258_10500 [Terrabacter aeriphilus]|uniref:YjbR protein n=1 Tax=Terrabacter aeriphilus TaxID=515662 RepID=A0ABP9J605_9MICO
MTLDDVDTCLGTLEGIRARRSDARRAWYVDGLLVARADAAGTVLVRLGGRDREQLVAAHPDTFGVPPRWEAHDKLQADLSGDADAIQGALRLAWERRRSARARG